MHVCSLKIDEYETGVLDSIPNECQFWQRLTGKIDIGQEMQDLKNYIGLKDLEKAKYNALKMVEPVPARGEQIFSGIKFGILENALQDDLTCNNQVFATQNFGEITDSLLNASGCTGRGPSIGSDFIVDHLKNYCSQAEADKGLCVASKFCEAGTDPATCQENGDVIALPYDLMGSSLLRYTTFPNKVVKEGAKRFVENMIAAAMPENIKPEDVFLNVNDARNGKYVFKNNGDNLLANKYKGISLLSMAQNTLFRMYAERKGSNDGVNPQDGQFLGKSANRSLLGTLEVESKRRYQDPNWHNEINKISDTALLRELSNMYALQLLINFRMSKHLERVEALLAVRNAHMANEMIGSIEKAKLSAQDGAL